jgi:hypothetical protein
MRPSYDRSTRFLVLFRLRLVARDRIAAAVMTASRLNAPRIYSPSLNRPMNPRSAGVKPLPSGQPALLRRHSALPKSLLWAQSQPRLRRHMANVR